ncbi:MAG: EF-hand domain-containing protein [Gammaproteobacteria bacterium]|nr:EF-hand domain-containing protein [Gammaproteobacteria bacterium]
MNRKLILLTLSPCLFFSPSIFANDALLTFEEMDRDSNGYISSHEARANKDIARNFKQIDNNGDAKINLAEFQAYRGKDLMTPPEDMETPEPGAAPY